MFDGKDNKPDKPLNFKELRQNVVEAAEPVVGAVQRYQPYEGKGKYKPDLNELPETLASFFRSTADAIEGRGNLSEGEAPLDTAAAALKDAKLDKKASDLTDKGSKFLSDRLDDARGAVADAELDKKAAKLAKNAGDLKLDKKAAKLAKQASSNLKDAKLDKKAGDVAGNVGSTLVELAAPVVAAVSDLAGKATDSVKDAKLDKKFGDVTSTLGDKVKDARFDKKASDLTSTAGDLVSNVGDTVSSFLKDAKLDKKAATVAGTATDVASNLSDTVSSFIKDAKLDKKASDVAGNVSDTVSGFLKDSKLDKKAVELAGTVAAPVLAKVKEAELDKKAADVAGTVSSKVKDAKLDKLLADMPERAFAAANYIPGLEVKNPKKAAKQFRKKRKAIIKAVNGQQKELNKALKQGSKGVSKYVQARQKDIQSGKIQIPGYVPPQKAGFPWGRTVLGAGLVYGGLAANNVRVWSNVPPLQSKLPGESHYYRSRQGVVFYKEAGQDQDNKAPVVFVHGIGAGNHSYEWEANFGPISEQYKVYAYDLLGFGNSERPNLRYTAEVYIKQLTEFLDEVVKRPAIVIASSLCSSYAVQVAFRRPQLIQKLVLMEPTGIFRREGYTGPNLVGPFSGAAYATLRAPVIGKSIYSGVASRAGIKSFMENQMFYNKDLATPERIEQYWTAAHQDGAEFAPPSFFTGLLNAEIGETLAKIEQPVMLIWGSESRITPPQERKELSEKNKNARVETVERVRLALNQERPEEFNRLSLDFLGQPSEPVKTANDSVGFVRSNVDTHQEPRDSRPVSEQLPPQAEKPEQPDYTNADWTHRERSEKGTPSTNMEAAQAAGSQAKGVEYENQNLLHELEEHRKTFIGDADTGSALVQDQDNDGVDDRLM